MSLTPSFSISDSFPPTGEDRLADTSQSSTLRDLLDLLCNSGRRLDWKPDSLPRELSSLLDLPLDVFLKKHRKLACFVQEFARTRFVVKQKVSRDSYRLLFEGRFLSADLSSNFKPFAQNKPTWHIALDKEGHVVKCSKKPSSLPKSHLLPKSAKAPGPSFGELVLGKELASRRGCNLPEQDPQSQPEAVRLLAEWGVSERVNVNFCVCLLPKSVPVCWIYPAVATAATQRPRFLRLEAFTGAKNRLRFRKEVVNRPGGRTKKFLFEKASAAAAENAAAAAVDEEEDAIEEGCGFGSGEVNRTSAMTVHLTGLSLAHKLGLLSQLKHKAGTEVLEELSSELCKAAGFFWLQRDAFGRVRHVTYVDSACDIPACFEIGPGRLVGAREIKTRGTVAAQEESRKREFRLWEDWKRLFDYVWLRRGFLLDKKKRATFALWGKLGTQTELGGGTHGRCFTSLKTSLAKTRLYCFSTDDSSLHSLKLFFARYCEEVRLLGRLQLRTVNGTQISCLQTSELEVENAAQFFHFGKSSLVTAAAADDPDASALLQASQDWCPELGRPFDHEVETAGRFWGEKIPPEARARVDDRGVFLARRLAATHVAFAGWICRRFQLDLSTSPFLTLSSLSFRAAMLDFWKKGGPSAQSIEKTKPHWEDCLRKLCKGGFSYSFRSHISSGNFLTNDIVPAAAAASATSAAAEAQAAAVAGAREKTSAIAEFDLKSCYGYSLTNMAAPGCFGVGYTFSEEKKCLVRTDRHNRAKSFEYLGVQSLVNAASASHPGKVAAVWSNFSPLGILYIGKYPLDLAIVVEGEALLLIQFDGQVRLQQAAIFYFSLAPSFCLPACPPACLSFFFLSPLSLSVS
jgi:hypothetical protein